LSESEQRVWRTYLLGAAELLERLDTALRPFGLTLNEYSILVCLSESPDRRLRMSELADAVHQSPSRLTHTISRMELAGRVERTTCGADRRGVWAQLTDAGMKLLEDAAPAHVASVRRHFVDAAGPDDFAALGRVFDAVLDTPRDNGTMAPRQLLRVAPSPTASPEEAADEADPDDTAEFAEPDDPRLNATLR